MPTELYILWACFAVMYLMSPIGAIIVQIVEDKKNAKAKK